MICTPGEVTSTKASPSYFAQRQGYVGNTLGWHWSLPPTQRGGTRAYLDAPGRPACRQAGLGRDGLIFRLSDRSVVVYWDPRTDGGNGSEAYRSDPLQRLGPLAGVQAALEMGCCFGGVRRLWPGGQPVLRQVSIHAGRTAVEKRRQFEDASGVPAGDLQS